MFFVQNEHVHKAHEMFRKANRVSRPDKALILGFMAGLRENPRPNSENVLVIKLGETEVCFISLLSCIYTINTLFV